MKRSTRCLSGVYLYKTIPSKQRNSARFFGAELCLTLTDAYHWLSDQMELKYKQQEHAQNHELKVQ